MEYQEKAEERFMRWEEERWENEAEMEEKRKREEREHEFRITQWLLPPTSRCP